MSEDFYDQFDESDYPDGIFCPSCNVGLTKDNVVRIYVEENIYLLGCFECLVENRIEVDTEDYD